MPSICFVNPKHLQYTPAGAEVQIFLLGREFAARGWKVFHVTEDFRERTVQDGTHFVPFRPGRTARQTYGKLEVLLNDLDADVYYQRGRHLYTYYLGKYARVSGKQFIFASSMELDALKHKEVSRSQVTVDPRKLLKLVVGSYRRDRLTLWGMRQASVVLVQSASQQHSFQRNLSIESVVAKKIHPLPSGELKKSRPPLVLWLANVKRWKRPELFLHLAGRLQHLNCRFVMAGRMMDESYRDLVADHCMALNGKFSYLGGITYEQSNELIARASVFVNTSANYESTPNTFVQSWLRETPVVTLNHDPDDIIKDNQIGFHSQSVGQMARDIEVLITDSALRFEMATKGRAYAAREFSVEKNVGNLLSLIGRVC